MLGLILLYNLLLTSVSCFRIINCGNSKTSDRTSLQNNKSLIKFSVYDSPIQINQPDRVELWCESDCWFSECTLTHSPNTLFGCNYNNAKIEEIHQIKTKEDAYKGFSTSKRHICRFDVQKSFDCSGILTEYENIK